MRTKVVVGRGGGSQVMWHQRCFMEMGLKQQPKYRGRPVNINQHLALWETLRDSEDLATFRWMQEAELKHSRIAMVSVLLWPLSELAELDSVLAETQGLFTQKLLRDIAQETCWLYGDLQISAVPYLL